MSPFGKYESFDACVEANASKEDPKAYCATIKRSIEGKELSQSEKELIAADIASTAPEMPYGGATTFEEADTFQESLDKTAELNHLFYMAQDLSNNALRNPAIKPEDKAGKLEQIARGLATKVSQFIKGKSTEKPLHPKTSGLVITKDAKGDYRWVGFVSANFKDRDREIFPASVHQEYIDFLDRTKEYPELRIWHTPGTRFGVADWAEFEKGFVLMSGTIDKGKEAIAETIASMPDQGMSHGFKFHYREPGVIGFYRTFEVSVLPLTHAALPWTKLEITKEVGMKPEKRQYLEQVLGKDRVAEIIGQADTLQKNLVAAGIEWKDFDQTPEVPPVKLEDLMAAFKETAEYKSLADMSRRLVELEGVKEMVKGYPDVTAIFDASIKALQEENKALKAQIAVKQDDLVAALLRPRSGVQPSKSKENVIDEKDPLAKQAPKLPIDAKLAASLGAAFNR